MNSQKKRIEEALCSGLTIEYLELQDDSGYHADHYKVTQDDIVSHMTIIIWAKEFTGLSMLEQHKLVNNLLRDEFYKGLHALQIKIKKPEDLTTYKV